ncbi:9420_t:CDS:2, partial [Funneliformis mosseae]
EYQNAKIKSSTKIMMTNLKLFLIQLLKDWNKDESHWDKHLRRQTTPVENPPQQQSQEVFQKCFY